MAVYRLEDCIFFLISHSALQMMAKLAFLLFFYMVIFMCELYFLVLKFEFVYYWLHLDLYCPIFKNTSSKVVRNYLGFIESSCVPFFKYFQ